jgi:hypothetical protein
MRVSVDAFGERRARSVGTGQAVAQGEGNILIDRAGMGLFLLHAEFGQQVENDAGFDLKFSRQLVDSNFLHRTDCLVDSLHTTSVFS